MTINAPTVTGGRQSNRTPLGIGEEFDLTPGVLRYETTVDETGPARTSRMPLVSRFLSAFALGLTVSAISAVSFEIAGSDDGVFVSLLAGAGFLSLTVTAGLRWFSSGRL